MYYHIIPKYFADISEREIKLASLEIPELGLNLTDKELKTIKPYPNQRYHIGCLGHGFKGRNFVGLILETDHIISEFTKICTWTVHFHPLDIVEIAFRMKHITKYKLLDNNNLMFSEDKPYLSKLRTEKNYCDISVMEFCYPYHFEGVNVQDVYDKSVDEFYDDEGVIIRREQQIETYTTEIEAYRNKCAMRSKKLPSLETAMKLHNI